MSDDTRTEQTRSSWTPWNKGKLTGPKPPLKVREIWAIRIRLQLANKLRDLALFNLAIDSKLRGGDLVALRVRDVAHGGTVAHRAIVLQHKTQQPVQFERTDQTRESVAAWITHAKLRPDGFLFPSRVRQSPHLTTRQYARLVNRWVAMVGLDPADYGTHSLRRTKATLIYRRTKNLWAVQLLLGHRKLEGTVRYLGVEVEGALGISEQTEV
jgi:integrase